MLICEKDIVPFHEKYEWKEMINKKSKIIDHKYSKKFSMMYFNVTGAIKKSKGRYFIFS